MDDSQAPPTSPRFATLAALAATLAGCRRRWPRNWRAGLYFFVLLPLVALFAGRGPFLGWACRLKRRLMGALSLPPDIAASLDLRGPLEELWSRHVEAEVLREADAYAALRLRGGKALCHFRFIHPEVLAAARGEGRPLLVLSGHYGSFYTLCIGLSRLGLRIFPIARAVDESPANPRSKRLFEKLNYRFSEAGLDGGYLYVDTRNRLSREFFTRVREEANANIFACLDTPGTPPAMGVAGQLLGRTMVFPKALLEFAAKQGAQVLIAWSRVTLGPDRRLVREIEFDPLPPRGLTPVQQVEYFAGRLDARLRQYPEQWLGLRIADAILQPAPPSRQRGGEAEA